MTRFQRTFLGIAFGAILALLLQPASRAVLAAATRSVPVDFMTEAFKNARRALPNPSTKVGAATWLIEAAERIQSRAFLSDKELRTVIDIADKGARSEVDNAFWLQMHAVLLDRAGEHVKAMDSWRRAANCVSYNDHQSEILSQARDDLATRFGGLMSWQSAVVYTLRSDAAAEVADRFGRSVIRHSTLETSDGVDRRYLTLINADLLRIGSRSVVIAKRASDLLEICTYPPDLVGDQSPKRLHLGAVKILESLRSRGRNDLAKRADRAFRENDSWRYYLFTRVNIPEATRLNSFQSILVATVPFSFAVVGIIGLVIFGMASFMPLERPVASTKAVIISSAAVLSMLILALISSSWLLGLATGAAVLFQLANPKNTRSHAPEDLGPFYRLVTFSLSLFIVLILEIYVISLLAPTRMVLYAMPITTELTSTREAAAGVLGLTISLYLLCVPMWSFVSRVSSWHVLRMSMRRLGQYLAGAAIVLIACSSLASVQIESQLRQTWQQAVANEPNYYLTH